MTSPFPSIRIGRYTFQNPLVMTPMTRSRAQLEGSLGELAAKYYIQRAGFGLIVSEGTRSSEDGRGYVITSSIFTDAHVQGWKKTTDAVHAKGATDACRSHVLPRPLTTIKALCHQLLLRTSGV